MEIPPHLVDMIIKTAGMVLVAAIAQILVNVVVRMWMRVAQKRADLHRSAKPTRTGQLLSHAGIKVDRSHQRWQTMGSVLRSVAAFGIWIVTILTVLNVWGLPMAPLITGAGVGGVALAFGAQSLVKDFLTGLFMIMEDQYGVGDFIRIGEVAGTVEEVTLRATRLRDQSGLVWYIPNGEIKSVGNVSQGWTSAIVDIPVSYQEDPAGVRLALQEMIDGLDLSEDWAAPLLDPPTVLGVGSLTGGTLTMQLMAKCEPNQQYGVQRELRARAKDALDAAGIQGPPAFGPK